MRKLTTLTLFMIFALPLGLAYGSSTSDESNELTAIEFGFEDGNGFVYYADDTKDRNNVFTHLGEGIPEGFSRETNSNIYRYGVASPGEYNGNKEIIPRTYKHETFLFQRLGIQEVKSLNQSRGYYWGSDLEDDSGRIGKVGYNDNGNPLIISREKNEAFYFLGSCITPAHYTIGEVLIKGFSIDGDILFELVLSIELEVGESPTYYDMLNYDYEGTPISEFKVFSLEMSSQNFDDHIAAAPTAYQFVLDRLTFGVEEEGGTGGDTPEPATLLIFGSCAMGLPFWLRRRRQA